MALGPRQRRAGMTLVEVAIAATILSIVLIGVVTSMQQEAGGLSDRARLMARERLASETMVRIESLLKYAQPAAPTAFLSTGLGAGDTTAVDVDTTLGYPPDGTLLFEPGTADEERVDYTVFDPANHRFEGLVRGAHGTDDVGHPSGVVVHWAGLASAIEDQDAPPADQWDGVADSDAGDLFYRGDGTGFSFRLPTDPAGGDDFFDAGGITWGATVDGVPTLDGWAALTFRATDVLREDATGQDLNHDGDAVDVFELGSLVLLRWDSVGGGPADRANLCAPILVQEQDARGSDLDGDGFQDPMFLWIPEEQRVEVRLTAYLGELRGRAVVRQFRTSLHLKNGNP